MAKTLLDSARQSSDRYQQFASSGVGKALVGRLGLPEPVRLRRYEPGQPLLNGPALIGGAGRLAGKIGAILGSAQVDVVTEPGEQRLGAVIFDASAITTPTELSELYEFFHPAIRRLAPSGRVLVLGSAPETQDSTEAAVAMRALEGFTRSVGKELKRGATSQLVYVAPGSEDAMESTVRFLLSARSAYVDGQVVRISPAASVVPPADWQLPLAGKTALVTGASRGIGAAIASVFARDGARVICLDVPSQGAQLSTVANAVNGRALQLDITASEAPLQLVDYFSTREDGVDIVVHNAGITRDKTLGRMTSTQWNSVLEVNLASQLRINDALLANSTLNAAGRIIGVSSIAGIAGNVGQTNYGTTKAGVIGMVDALAPKLASIDATINAVAPGFIETAMTAAVPLFIREAGRRMNSMSQGGLPIDVAETIAWYASPGSGAVNGNVVRVCGQSLLGA